MRVALAAGWRRRDLWWERLMEAANRDWLAGRKIRAYTGFRLVLWLSRVFLPKQDVRHATCLANLAILAGAAGNGRRAERLIGEAKAAWARMPAAIAGMTVQRRARSSLYHLRMEERHWDTYCENMRTRLGRIADETGQTFDKIALGEPAPHRHFSRWRGERPVVFDDTRKILGACLLIVDTVDRRPDQH